MAIGVSYVEHEGKKFAECDADGKIIFIDDELPEEDSKRRTPVNVVDTYKSVPELRREAANNRKAAEEAAKKVEIFGDLDPVKAREAMQTVKDLKDGELIKAGEVALVRKSMEEGFNTEKKNIIEGFENKNKQLLDEVANRETTIRKLMISNQFAKSSFFTGENAKTILPPEIAETYFGDKFKVEQINGEPVAVAYLKGEKIYSKSSPGELASFEESIQMFIDEFPNKNRILASTKGGPGLGGEFKQTTTGVNGVMKVTREQMKDTAFYKHAKEQAAKGITVEYVD